MVSLLLTALCGLVALTGASHFEGGTISWKVLSGYQVNFDWSQGWILGRGPCGSGCSASNVGAIGITNNGNWACTSGCSGNLAAVSYTVTGVNTIENWEQGSNSFQYTFSSAGPFSVSFTGNAWRALNYGSGGTWAVLTEIYLGSRSDSGKPNASPIASGSPIYRLQYGCSNSIITIPMLDPDGDSVTCRWASGTSECASVCNLLPHSTLSSSGSMCTITVNTAGTYFTAGGWYAGAVQVDDFPLTSITAGTRSYGPANRISTVPVQFLVYTPSMSVSCTAIPTWVSPTPAQSHQFSIQSGGFIIVTARASSTSGGSITSIVATGPPGGTTSTLSTSGADGWITWSWTPSSSQTGGFNLCFQASDTIGKAASRCVAIAVAVQCTDPGTPTGMTRTATGGPPFYFGNAITYTCPTGHELTSGNAVRTCQLSGSFDGSAPVCTIKSCSALSAPANGAMSGSSVTYNSVVTFTCSSGYTGSGSASRTCQNSKTWSGTAFTCSRISCGDPGAVADSTRSAPGFKFGDTIAVTCSTGYQITVGNAQRTCLASGSWDRAQPVCTSM